MDNIVNLCSSIFFSAEAIGFNHVMRQAVINDPNFNNGDYYDGTPPNQGLSIARMLGMLTYHYRCAVGWHLVRATKSEGQFWGDQFLK